MIWYCNICPQCLKIIKNVSPSISIYCNHINYIDMKVINIDGLTMILNVVRFARIVENETFYVIFKHYVRPLVNER